jgi:uncharacterized protein (TIGR00369 family)
LYPILNVARMRRKGQCVMRAAVLSVEELERLLARDFPEAFNADSGLAILDVWYGGSRVRQSIQNNATRPGGTVSGPTIMALADVAMYVAVLASIGWVPLAVTTNLNINFLKKPVPGALVAECRLLKVGKRLAVGEAAIRCEGEEDLVAHATSTYSIPPSG